MKIYKIEWGTPNKFQSYMPEADHFDPRVLYNGQPLPDDWQVPQMQTIDKRKNTFKSIFLRILAYILRFSSTKKLGRSSARRWKRAVSVTNALSTTSCSDSATLGV